MNENENENMNMNMNIQNSTSIIFLLWVLRTLSHIYMNMFSPINIFSLQRSREWLANFPSIKKASLVPTVHFKQSELPEL